MPTKCIDQMPKPMAKAPPISQESASRPFARVTRPAMSRAV
ncbi:hypothetical protein X778_24365 [Pseudomonas aeruginosa VRFPA07]|nr:hypothetical protein X778_24365 [Pseudomonas aeruginosa VRFPA07]